MEYPLYDNLVELVQSAGEEDLTPKDVQKLAISINKLSDEDLMEIGLIILEHYMRSDASKTNKSSIIKRAVLPYGAKVFDGKKGASFPSSSKLPKDLLMIIKMFVYQEFEFPADEEK
jgi:hypothetical protein